MVVFIVVGLGLSYFGGMTLDTLYTEMSENGYDGGVGTDWDSTGCINIFINIFYAVCYILPLMGIATFGLSLTKRNRYDHTDEYQVYDDPADYGDL